MPRHRPHQPRRQPRAPPPTLTHPCTTGGGGGTRDREWMREIKHEEREETEGDGGNRGQTEMRMREKDDRRNTLVIHSVLVLKRKKNTHNLKLCSFPKTHKTPRTAFPKKIYDTADIMLGCPSSHLMRCIYGHSKFWLNWKIGIRLAHS